MKKPPLHCVPPSITGDSESTLEYIARLERGLSTLDEAIKTLRERLEKQKAEARKLRLL